MKRRTQIYLDNEVYRDLKEIADRRDASISEVIRERIGKPARAQKPTHDARAILDEIYQLGKRMKWSKDTPRDLSERIDEFVYGAPKKR